jgi:predicted Fe-Mo cluster-binding NifX family protein
MKVGIASDDGEKISHHFGRALGFVVYKIENNNIINHEYRKNIGKSNGECGSCNHDFMINNIKDCNVIISYGMGRRIYDDLIINDIKPVVTEEKTVEEAINKFIKDELKNRVDRLH